MDSEGTFNAEYYQKLLNTLTINSRAVITELTSIAEKNVDKCNEICELVELRIKRCLPQYKLIATYLLDSICKNIGNPYNIVFGKNLFKLFTETYSIVTDTPTRQNLINLFKTWVNAKTNTGAELFPAPILGKIENFIIKATSISGGGAPSNGQPMPSMNGGPTNSVVAPEVLFKDIKNLLLFIVNLNKTTDSFGDKLKEFNEADQKTFHDFELRRNQIVTILNESSDAILVDLKSPNPEQEGSNMYESTNRKYFNEFQSIRKELDDQYLQHQQIIKRNQPNLNANYEKQQQESQRILEKKRKRAYIESQRVTLDFKPNLIYFTKFNDDINEDEKFMAVIKEWGKVPVSREETEHENAKEEHPVFHFSSNLGMDFSSLNFLDSILSNTDEEKLSKNDNPTDNNGESKSEVVEIKSASNSPENSADSITLEEKHSDGDPELELVEKSPEVPQWNNTGDNYLQIQDQFQTEDERQTDTDAESLRDEMYHNDENQSDTSVELPEIALGKDNGEYYTVQSEEEDGDSDYSPDSPPPRQIDPYEVEDDDEDYTPTLPDSVSSKPIPPTTYITQDHSFYHTTSQPLLPPSSHINKRSILKRKAVEVEPKVRKRVRFDL